MNKFCLIVQIEINGLMTKAGVITGTNSTDAVFVYDKDYISNQNNRPISISLPFSKTKFSPEETRNYFEGLLPEGFTRKTIANSIHADSDDYILILKELGKECLGAIQIVDDLQDLFKADYKELSKDEVKALAEEGASTAVNLLIKSHLSLTGASGKTGLYYENKLKKWYQPLGSAPSNYIIKQSHVRLENIVVNEQLCLLTAKKLGIEIPESFIIQTEKNKTKDEYILFATKRYDRFIDSNSKIINGLVVPYRLHQEDFAQALGIKASCKYEKNNEHYLKKMFDIINVYTENPLENQLKLWRICVFNFFIGNTDNHIKNYSLVYSKDLKKITLAPCYDVVSTRVYEKSTNEMSLTINGKLKIEDVFKKDFEEEAKILGIGVKVALQIYDEICNGLKNALYESTKELELLGFNDAKKIAEKILSTRI